MAGWSPGEEAVFEAKACWLADNTRNDSVELALTLAVSDARRHGGDLLKVGVVFHGVRPNGTATEAVLRRQVERIQAMRPDAVAWCFPNETRALRSEFNEFGDVVWPGVIMAMKVA